MADLRLENVDDSELTIDDIGDLLDEMQEVAVNYKGIGIALRLNIGEVNIIEKQHRHDPRAALSGVLEQWLNLNYTTKKGEAMKMPSWRRVVEVVDKRSAGGNHALAKRIAANHYIAGRSQEPPESVRIDDRSETPPSLTVRPNQTASLQSQPPSLLSDVERDVVSEPTGSISTPPSNHGQPGTSIQIHSTKPTDVKESQKRLLNVENQIPPKSSHETVVAKQNNSTFENVAQPLSQSLEHPQQSVTHNEYPRQQPPPTELGVSSTNASGPTSQVTGVQTFATAAQPSEEGAESQLLVTPTGPVRRNMSDQLDYSLGVPTPLKEASVVSNQSTAPQDHRNPSTGTTQSTAGQSHQASAYVGENQSLLKGGGYHDGEQQQGGNQQPGQNFGIPSNQQQGGNQQPGQNFGMPSNPPNHQQGGNQQPGQMTSNPPNHQQGGNQQPGQMTSNPPNQQQSGNQQPGQNFWIPSNQQQSGNQQPGQNFGIPSNHQQGGNQQPGQNPRIPYNHQQSGNPQPGQNFWIPSNQQQGGNQQPGQMTSNPPNQQQGGNQQPGQNFGMTSNPPNQQQPYAPQPHNPSLGYGPQQQYPNGMPPWSMGFYPPGYIPPQPYPQQHMYMYPGHPQYPPPSGRWVPQGHDPFPQQHGYYSNNTIQPQPQGGPPMSNIQPPSNMTAQQQQQFTNQNAAHQGQSSPAAHQVQSSPVAMATAEEELSTEAVGTPQEEISRDIGEVHIERVTEHTNDGHVMTDEGKSVTQHNPLPKTNKFFPVRLSCCLARPEKEELERYQFPDDEKYSMSKAPHGIAVVINNKTFKHEDRRDGTDIDCKDLVLTFRYLGYIVLEYKDKTAKEICHIIDKIASLKKFKFEGKTIRDHSDFDSFVCCIMSHGENGAVYGIDSKKVQITHLTYKLRSDTCPSLAGKPKMFFIQACRGPQMDGGGATTSMTEPILIADQNSDAVTDGPTSKVADIFVGYSTSPDFVSFRDPIKGSWYVWELCVALCAMSTSRPLVDIMLEVNRKVNKEHSHHSLRQAPIYKSSLLGKVFFWSP